MYDLNGDGKYILTQIQKKLRIEENIDIVYSLMNVKKNHFTGVITKTEMGNVVVAVCELMGIDLRPPVRSHLFFIK